MKKRTISEGDAVTIHYRLTLEDGTVADNSFGGEPLVYVHGAGNIVPGLERQLTGLSAGDEQDFEVGPAEGYGNHDSRSERTLSRTELPPGIQLKPGMSLQAQGPNGAVTIWVRKIEGDQVTLSTSHPLAGQTLRFHVKILSIREPSEAEKKPPDT